MDTTVTLKKEGKEEYLEIKIPVDYKKSNSGKTMLVASTNGNVVTEAKYKDKPITLGLNAWIKPD
jgi:hypothetical protein